VGAPEKVSSKDLPPIEKVWGVIKICFHFSCKAE